MGRPLGIMWKHTEEKLYELYRPEKDAELYRREVDGSLIIGRLVASFLESSPYYPPSLKEKGQGVRSKQSAL